MAIMVIFVSDASERGKAKHDGQHRGDDGEYAKKRDPSNHHRAHCENERGNGLAVRSGLRDRRQVVRGSGCRELWRRRHERIEKAIAVNRHVAGPALSVVVPKFEAVGGIGIPGWRVERRWWFVTLRRWLLARHRRWIHVSERYRPGSELEASAAVATSRAHR